MRRSTLGSGTTDDRLAITVSDEERKFILLDTSKSLTFNKPSVNEVRVISTMSSVVPLVERKLNVWLSASTLKIV